MKDSHALLEAVYRQQGEKLWRALVGFTNDPEVASEARAEAFAQALSRGDALRSPAAWIWTSAFRIAAGMLSRPAHEELPRSEQAWNPPEPIHDLVHALASLPPRQRMTIVMHDYADRPTGEIASTLGITRATVHVHLSRGRKRLRSLLEENLDE